MSVIICLRMAMIAGLATTNHKRREPPIGLPAELHELFERPGYGCLAAKTTIA